VTEWFHKDDSHLFLLDIYYHVSKIELITLIKSMFTRIIFYIQLSAENVIHNFSIYVVDLDIESIDILSII
jgi:hypothetical protein